MVSARRASLGGIAITAALVAVIAAGFAGPANAAPAWLKNVLSGGHGDDGRTTPPPVVARYQIEQGEGFVLDLADRPPLLKFDNSPEIWALKASHGPRGDVLYINDIGELMVRSTKLGGMTVYTAERPEGAAAAVVGPASAFRPKLSPPPAFDERLVMAAARCSHLARHTVGVATVDDKKVRDAKAEAIIADATTNVVEALTALPYHPSGRTALGHIGMVMFNVSHSPNVELQRGILSIDVVPSQGFAGRPSSARILLAIGPP
jgi:hypothetical protein